MIITKVLTDNVMSVDVYDAENILIQNIGDSAVYASTINTVVPGNDGVLAIPAGGQVTIQGACKFKCVGGRYNWRGKIYFKGPGTVQCISTDVVNFRGPQKGGGSSGLTLGETSITAYYGDRGKAAYDHSQLTAGNPHGVTKTDVGLDKVDNTSDADKPISTLQQAEFDKKLDTGKSVGKKVTAVEGAEIFNDYVDNIATGEYSHAEGHNTKATNTWAHAEGADTRAAGDTSHAEGYSTHAAGSSSHSEGHYTWSGGSGSHSEGRGTSAEGSASHAEGEYSYAAGEYAHVEGHGTVATGEAQHVEGTYNIEDTENKFAHIIGNGTSRDNRSNAFAIDWNGNIYVNNSTTGVNVNDLQAASHMHSNKEIIDKLSVDESGKLLYDGNPISSGGISYASQTVAGVSKMWTTTEDGTTTLNISTEE